MIWQIALGVVFGVLLLIAIFLFAVCVLVVIGRVRVRTVKKYDFEEDYDEFDEYD